MFTCGINFFALDQSDHIIVSAIIVFAVSKIKIKYSFLWEYVMRTGHKKSQSKTYALANH